MQVTEVSKRRLGLIVRIFFSVALIGVLAYNIGSADILGQMKAVRWHVVAFAVAVLSCSVLLVTPRWAAILATLGYPLPPLALIKSVFVGFAFNQLLPTGFGGDVPSWRARVSTTSRALEIRIDVGDESSASRNRAAQQLELTRV